MEKLKQDVESMLVTATATLPESELSRVNSIVAAASEARESGDLKHFGINLRHIRQP
jgi:hypothetical protein